jgi:hypothetical protein
MNYINCATRLILNGALEIIWTLIDLSGSMEKDDWKPSRMAGAVAANKELIRVKTENYPTDSMGIIGFGTNAEVLHGAVPVGTGMQILYQALDSVDTMGETNITAALELAEKKFFANQDEVALEKTAKNFSHTLSYLLFGTTHNESSISVACEKKAVTKRIILLSDGGHNATGRSPLKRASTLKSEGVIIDCIGIGTPDDINESLLKKIASCNPDGSIRYCFIGDKHQLIRKYESLAHHIRLA